ncbi:hypothetical protein A8B84_20530 [Marinobacter sp. EhC06]|uniref:opioid growth factor receptor-related protein n=1 Tax=Marinobacter TaxID=2742 RepID=UPI0007D90874|nr:MULTISPECIES: opioid growth factor receptor-related protein [unclassified Marinobacter]OAN92952.1 hypothetical protein A8B84_20530 [Marinobacter sp. EhC06]OAN93103.1 hypothetical protein A8B80_17845 [Marinobacter sp. EhN04]
MTSTEKLIGFTLGDTPDHSGRLIHGVWAFSDSLLETTHDYIQWLFPIPESNEVNQFAPVLTDEARIFFRGSDTLRAQQEKSLNRMLIFLGLEKQRGAFVAALDINAQQHRWLNRFDHNHRRITRMIRSLDLCGQPERAKKLRTAVIEVGKRHGDVPEGVMDFWRQATDRSQ